MFLTGPALAAEADEPAVTSFTLVNATTGEDIVTLADGDQVDLAETDYFISIRAEVSGDEANSVEFALNDDPGYSLDSQAPFYLDGDRPSQGTINAWYQPLLGEYSLTATPFTESGARGDAGASMSIGFTVVDGNEAVDVDRMRLVDVADGTEVYRFSKSVENCGVVDLATMPDFSIEALTTGGVAGSLEFGLNDDSGYNLIEEGPFYLDGTRQSDGAISAWSPAIGQNTITATAYTGDDQAGQASEQASLDVTVVDSNDTAVPASTGSWDDARTALFFYGCYDEVDLDVLAQYDTIVFEPSAMTPDTLVQLKALNPDIFLLAYLTIGESDSLLVDADGEPLDIYFLDANGDPIVNPNWGSHYIDARKTVWQDLVLNTYLPNIFALGFDGAFLDTVDTSAYDDPAIPITGSDSAGGMAELIRAMDSTFADKVFVPNRGFHLLRGGENDVSAAVDGVLFENFTAVWYSTKLDETGANIPWYHVYPTDSYEDWWTADTAQQLNRRRFVYNDDGTVQRDADGQPVKSDTYLNILVHDYALDGDTEAMQAIVDRAWEYGLVPSMSERQIEEFPYNWQDVVAIPSEADWASSLDFDLIPPPDPFIDQFDDDVDGWIAFREDHNRPDDPSDPTDEVALSLDDGAARLDFTVQGQGIAYRNSAYLRSPEWFNPVDMTDESLSFNIKLDSLAPAGEKGIEAWLVDHNNDVMAWSLGYQVTTANEWTPITLSPADGVYYGAWDGADDGFQWDQVRAVQFRVANALADSPVYSGSMWLDDIQVGVPDAAPSVVSNEVLSNTASSLSMSYDYTGSVTSHYIYMDADQDPATGFTVTGHDGVAIGADHVVIAGVGGSFYTLYAHDPAAGNGWGWIASSNVITFADAAGAVSAELDLSWIGEDGDTAGIDVVFGVEDAGVTNYSNLNTHVYSVS